MYHSDSYVVFFAFMFTHVNRSYCVLAQYK